MDMKLCEQPDRPNYVECPVAELDKCLTIWCVMDEDKNGKHNLEYKISEDSLVNAEYAISRWLAEDPTKAFVVLLTYYDKRATSGEIELGPSSNVETKGICSHIKSFLKKHLW